MRVPIDTNFILPALGVDVGETVLDLIKEFRNHQIYYIELSLLEAMCVIKRLMRRGEKVDLDVVRIGLKSVSETYHLGELSRPNGRSIPTSR